MAIATSNFQVAGIVKNELGIGLEGVALNFQMQVVVINLMKTEPSLLL